MVKTYFNYILDTYLSEKDKWDSRLLCLP
jgi:hypothetical protein